MTGRRGLLAGLALIAVTNGMILGGVAWNRSAEEARIELTERELALPWNAFRDDDDSGLALRWSWRRPRADWLDRDKLRELGFDVSVPPGDPQAEGFYAHALPREAFMVLEMDGEAWRRDLADREEELRKCMRGQCPEEYPNTPEEMRTQLDQDRRMGSRLLAVDAGTDPEELRRRYPDRSRHLVLRASVSIHLAGQERKLLEGRLSGPQVGGVHVPRSLRPVLDEIVRNTPQEAREAPKAPRYRVTVAAGRRYEPWAVEVERIGEGLRTAAR